MQFSIKNILSETAGIGVQNRGRLALVALAAIGGTLLISVVVGVLVALFFGGGVLARGIIGILVAFAMVTLFAGLFNYLVRLGALGPSRSFNSFKKMLSAAAVNGMKFIFISLILGVAVIIVSMVMAIFIPVETTADFDPASIKTLQDAITAYKAALKEQLTLSAIITSVIFTFVVSGIYAVFSANLTKTALDDTHSSYETPHTFDFALVLFILYMVNAGVQYLTILSGSTVLMFGGSFVIGYLSFALIAIAHGVRHRMCAPVEASIDYKEQGDVPSQGQDQDDNPWS